ncbi:MAG TPA: hypothetical protein VGX25_26415 [Actinophytocola sp.]|uniref:hypothetical protein n=1 Tax=Actinophytocola sp. TaxID=1872138 RepID=UPI002DDD3CB0|nr:hypothetical protein [Actinophytocola sp.]HEV2782938.1 hypothetical protein [Actinophytocola sp.]
MAPATLTIDELIAASAALDDRADGLLDRLARITARATEHGISVTVNLDGQLIGLDLTDAALRLAPTHLASEIHRLTLQASATALAEGITTLEPLAGDELLQLLVPPVPEPTPAPVEDFSAIESWAVPR